MILLRNHWTQCLHPRSPRIRVSPRFNHCHQMGLESNPETLIHDLGFQGCTGETTCLTLSIVCSLNHSLSFRTPPLSLSLSRYLSFVHVSTYDPALAFQQIYCYRSSSFCWLILSEDNSRAPSRIVIAAGERSIFHWNVLHSGMSLSLRAWGKSVSVVESRISIWSSVVPDSMYHDDWGTISRYSCLYSPLRIRSDIPKRGLISYFIRVCKICARFSFSRDSSLNDKRDSISSQPAGWL